MSLYKTYGTDKSAENEGVRVTFGKNDDGSEIAFTISRMSKSNVRYAKALEKAVQPHLREIELETFDEARANELYLDLFCSIILLGWEHVLDADGKPLAFTVGNAKTLLTDLPDLYDELKVKAQKATLFREAAREAKAKN